MRANSSCSCNGKKLKAIINLLQFFFPPPAFKCCHKEESHFQKLLRAFLMALRAFVPSVNNAINFVEGTYVSSNLCSNSIGRYVCAVHCRVYGWKTRFVLHKAFGWMYCILCKCAKTVCAKGSTLCTAFENIVSICILKLYNYCEFLAH